MLYGHLLELVEAWIKLLGVLLSSLAGVIIADYYIVTPIIKRRLLADRDYDDINWAGVITIVVAVLSAHYLIKPYQPIEVFTSLSVTLLLYPALRLMPAPK
jgi:cytosine permease